MSKMGWRQASGEEKKDGRRRERGQRHTSKGQKKKGKRLEALLMERKKEK